MLKHVIAGHPNQAACSTLEASGLRSEVALRPKAKRLWIDASMGCLWDLQVYICAIWPQRDTPSVDTTWYRISTVDCNESRFFVCIHMITYLSLMYICTWLYMSLDLLARRDNRAPQPSSLLHFGGLSAPKRGRAEAENRSTGEETYMHILGLLKFLFHFLALLNWPPWKKI